MKKTQQDSLFLALQNAFWNWVAWHSENFIRKFPVYPSIHTCEYVTCFPIHLPHCHIFGLK